MLHDDLEPTVRIRDLKKDRVNFVLENVDLAYACRLFALSSATSLTCVQVREFIAKGRHSRHSYHWWVATHRTRRALT
jgi:hypothetical protein